VNEHELKAFVEENWRNESALRSIIDTPTSGGSKLWHFGEIPTEQAEVEIQDGLIKRITVWSGLNWSARGGYGRPFTSIKYRERQTA
jgi:hypothetical protein